MRKLHQAGAKSISVYAARTSKLCSCAYTTFSTDAQTSLAVAQFGFTFADTASREYLRPECARLPVAWQKAIQIAQAGEIAELDCSTTTAAAAFASVEDCARSRECDAANAHAIADTVAQQQAITAMQQATLALQQAIAAPMWQSGGRAHRLQKQSNSIDLNCGVQRTDRSRFRKSPLTSNPREPSRSHDQSRTH